MEMNQVCQDTFPSTKLQTTYTQSRPASLMKMEPTGCGTTQWAGPGTALLALNWHAIPSLNVEWLTHVLAKL